jgi:hypothetical protein
MKNSLIPVALLATTLAIPALADDQTTQPAALSTPSMSGPLALNPNPYNIDAGPLGKIYASGIISGLAMAQTNHVPHDENSLLDLSNA